MKWLRFLIWGFIGASVLCWFGLRESWPGLRPTHLAGLVALTLLLLLPVLGDLLARLARSRTARGRTGAAALMVTGLLGVGVGGMANWLWSLQGWVILAEQEGVPLFEGSHLQGYEAGPLADPAEMDLTLQLEEIDLVAVEGDFFYPRSRIRLLAPGREPTTIFVQPGKAAPFEKLRIHQGAFGFAPRVVMVRDGSTVFDQVVPFLTERQGESALSFEGRFTVGAEDLEVRGIVDLASLDEAMRGHATLHLEVAKGGARIGRGSLLPGHFAELTGGYRIGFAGLDKWSEINISRRNYGTVVVAGAGLAVAGLVLWLLAAWRGR